MVSIRPDEISAILKKQIEDYDKSVSVSNVGTVLTVGDGIARVYGLQQAMAQVLQRPAAPQTQSSLTAIPRRMHRISFDLRS